jgi:hypothetical protein
VTEDSGIVTADSGHMPKIGHLRAESAVTFGRNGRSRSSGISGHDGPENANSRMKDFYDVWICSKHLDFDTDTLLKAISATFKNRETSVPAQEFEALTATFAAAHRVQWNAFVRKMNEDELIDGFGMIIEDIKTFAMPAFRSLASGEKIAQQWKAGNGWVIS